MLKRLLAWIKNNKLSSFLILLVSFYLLKNFLFNTLGMSLAPSYTDSYSGYGSLGGITNPSLSFEKAYPSSYSSSYNPPAPQPQVTNRQKVTNSTLSLLVKDVRNSIDEIENEVIVRKGYVVSSSVSRPEEGASGYMTVRVPSTDLKSFLAYLRNRSVKVVSEDITGQDITDEYMNVQARLDILNRNKETYMSFMDRATTIDEIMRVQQQIFTLQDQIDSLEGRLKYMDGASATSLVSINLSTDELALPYAPSQTWRPEVVFKYAVRALVGFLRTITNIVIWIGVFAVVWIPALILIVLFRKFLKKRQQIPHI